MTRRRTDCEPGGGWQRDPRSSLDFQRFSAGECNSPLRTSAEAGRSTFAGRALLVVVVAFAALITMTASVSAEADDVYSERTMKLAGQLQCPVCSGQSVADSQITLARQMRDVIEQKVQAGESDEQIIAYFEARYGQNVLLEPPKSGFALTLWWVPPIVLMFGAIVVVLYLRENTRPRAQLSKASDEDDSELDELASEYLGPGAERS